MGLAGDVRGRGMQYILAVGEGKGVAREQHTRLNTQEGGGGDRASTHTYKFRHTAWIYTFLIIIN